MVTMNLSDPVAIEADDGARGEYVALPFTIPSGSVDRAAEELVKKPIRYAFKRPLGELPEEQS